MHCTKKITSDLIWLGGSDRRLALFENVYPIPRGVSYNAYLIRDEKTALLDTVDQAIAERFFENLEYALQGRELNYVVVNHMEPDHAATLGEVLSRHPEAAVIGNAKTLLTYGYGPHHRHETHDPPLAIQTTRKPCLQKRFGTNG